MENKLNKHKYVIIARNSGHLSPRMSNPAVALALKRTQNVQRKCMKNEIFKGIFLEELANVKMCMAEAIHWSMEKHIVHE